MITGHYTGVEQFSGNAIAAIWICGVIAFFALVVLAIGVVRELFAPEAGGDGWISAGFSFLVLLFVGGGFVWGMWPFSHDYHYYRQYEGTVTSTNSRLLDSGNNSTEQKFAIQMAGSSQVYGCTDTRCSTLQVGDVVTLACEKVYQWNATDGLDCNFIDSKSSVQ